MVDVCGVRRVKAKRCFQTLKGVFAKCLNISKRVTGTGRRREASMPEKDDLNPYIIVKHMS